MRTIDATTTTALDAVDGIDIRENIIRKTVSSLSMKRHMESSAAGHIHISGARLMKCIICNHNNLVPTFIPMDLRFTIRLRLQLEF